MVEGTNLTPKPAITVSASDMRADNVERGKIVITSSLVGLTADAIPTAPVATKKTPPQIPSPESKHL